MYRDPHKPSERFAPWAAIVDELVSEEAVDIRARTDIEDVRLSWLMMVRSWRK